MSQTLPPIRIPTSRPALGAAELEQVRQVLDSAWLSVGEFTGRFEQRVADYLGVPHVVAVSTGTAALHMALAVLDLSPGDEVITPSMTFAAPVQMILTVGARPVFCEIEAHTLNPDPEDVARRITPKTRAILACHYGGYACDMRRLREIADRHGLALIDDAAHAFGSEYQGRKIGSLGNLSCFSFNPVKNITCGEGGAVTTSDVAQADRFWSLRNLGIGVATWTRLTTSPSWDYSIASLGFRYAMPNLNAAIGLAQLDRMDEFLRIKRALKTRYDQAFREVEGIALLDQNVEHAFPYTYAVRVPGGRRDALAAHLRRTGIGTAVHYPPNHRQPLFADPDVRLPITEQAAGEVLCLPFHACVSDADAEEVIGSVRTFFGG